MRCKIFDEAKAQDLSKKRSAADHELQLAYRARIRGKLDYYSTEQIEVMAGVSSNMLKKSSVIIIRLGRLLGFASVFFLISFLLQRFCYGKTDGFAWHKVVSSLSPSSEWESPPLPDSEREELDRLFKQPFYYLGKGAQAYVFSSADGQFVIKFCRFDHLRPPFWFSLLSFPFAHDYERERLSRLLHKRGRLEQEFHSYQIAFQEMKQETGLVYLHLNKTSFWNQTTTFYDKIGVAHPLDLDQMEFIVQKKASLVYPTISLLMQQGQETRAKAAITQLVKLLGNRYAKGIFDKDPDLMTNFGFLEDVPVQIDVGRFSLTTELKPAQEIREDLRRITNPLCQWLEKEYPTLNSHLIEEVAQFDS